MMIVKDLKQNEYNSYYSTYINKIPKDLDLIEGYIDGGAHVLQFFKAIPEEKLEYRYAEGKWTIKEVFQHIIDNERIFTYRCFRMGRRDKTSLAGYEQNDYAEPSKANEKSIETLLEEYEIGRKNSTLLIKSLSNDDLNFIGNASDTNMSARAAAFITLGHEMHHINVLKERYL
ncbi:MAG: DinB family protein [Algibacter sp.]